MIYQLIFDKDVPVCNHHNKNNFIKKYIDHNYNTIGQTITSIFK